MVVRAIRAIEESKIRTQNLRTFKLGLLSTLTYEQWLETLEYFDYSCAYCGGSYNAIDHFVPLDLKGGTTQRNCIPACMRDNVRKSNYPPEKFSLMFPAERMSKIRSYMGLFPEDIVIKKHIMPKDAYPLKIVAQYLQITETVLLQMTFDEFIDGAYCRGTWHYTEEAIHKFEESSLTTMCSQCKGPTHHRFGIARAKILCKDCAGIQSIGDIRKPVIKQRKNGKTAYRWDKRHKPRPVDILLQEGHKLLPKKEIITVSYMLDNGTLWRVVETIGEQVVCIRANKAEREAMRDRLIEFSSQHVEDVYKEEGEQLILDLVKAGKSNRTIALELGVTQLSVNAAVTRIMRQKNVRYRGDLKTC